MIPRAIKKKSCVYLLIILSALITTNKSFSAETTPAEASVTAAAATDTAVNAAPATASEATRPMGAETIAPNPEAEQPLDLDAAPAPGVAPYTVNTGALLLRVLIGLPIVALMIIFAVWIMKRASMGGGMVGAARGNLRVLDRLSVSPRRFVLIVQIPTRILLIGSDEKGLSLLGEITDMEEIHRYVQGTGAIPVFSEQLKSFINPAARQDAESTRHQTLRRMQSDLEQL